MLIFYILGVDIRHKEVWSTNKNGLLLKGINTRKKTFKNAEICGKSWLRNINFGRVREVLDLLELGKNVSDLVQRLSSENVSPQQNSGESSQNDTNAGPS